MGKTRGKSKITTNDLARRVSEAIASGEYETIMVKRSPQSDPRLVANEIIFSSHRRMSEYVHIGAENVGYKGSRYHG